MSKTPLAYIRKPSAVTAMQFTGGEEDAIAVIAWLNSMNIVAYWRPENEVTIGSAEIIKIDQLGNVRVNDWIVSFGSTPPNVKGFIQIMNEENFERRFEKRTE